VKWPSQRTPTSQLLSLLLDIIYIIGGFQEGLGPAITSVAVLGRGRMAPGWAYSQAPDDDRWGAPLLADGLDEFADKVFGRIKKMFECASIVRMATAAANVGRDIHHCGFEPVEPVMDPTKVLVSNDGLIVGKAQRGGAASGLEGSLAMGGRAELPGSPCPRPLVDRTVTPGAPRPFRGFRHCDDIRLTRPRRA